MSHAEQTQPIQVGDTVAYRWEVLHRRGWYTRDLLRARGKVTGLVPFPNAVFFRVTWDRPGIPTILSPQELCHVAAPRQRASA